MNEIVLRLFGSPGYTGIVVFTITLLGCLLHFSNTLPARGRRIHGNVERPPNLRALVSRLHASEFRITFFGLFSSIAISAALAAFAVSEVISQQNKSANVVTSHIFVFATPVILLFFGIVTRLLRYRPFPLLHRSEFLISQSIAIQSALVAQFAFRLVMLGRRRQPRASKTKLKSHTLTGLYSFSFNIKLIVVFVLQGVISAGAYVLRGRELIDTRTFSVVTCLSIALVLLAVVKQAVLSYRVRRGFFGTNGYEARQLIDFVRGSKDHWGNGKPSTVFLPEHRAVNCPDIWAVPERNRG